LLAGALAGALLAYFLTRDGGGTSALTTVVTHVRTVTTEGQVTTQQKSVTVTTAPGTGVGSGPTGAALNNVGFTKMQAGDYAGALDRLPPVAVVAVPVDRGTYALAPVTPRLPAECANFRRLERIAPVVAGAVLDASHE